MPCQHSCRPSCISKADTRFKGLTNSSKSCTKSFPVGYLYSLEWTTGNETSSPQLLSSVSLSLQASSKAVREAGCTQDRIRNGTAIESSAKSSRLVATEVEQDSSQLQSQSFAVKIQLRQRKFSCDEAENTFSLCHMCLQQIPTSCDYDLLNYECNSESKKTVRVVSLVQATE